MSNKPPIEVPQGAIRLNTDSQRLEFFAQDRWYEMATDVTTLDGGTRGAFRWFWTWRSFKHSGPKYNRILSRFQLQVMQLILDDASSTVDASGSGAHASKTRAVFMVEETVVVMLMNLLYIINRKCNQFW